MEAAGIEPAQDSPGNVDVPWLIHNSHVYEYWWANYAGQLESAQKQITLYVVGEGDDGPVKIGITDRLSATRLAGLQVANPRLLKVVVDIPAPKGLERQLHGVCVHERIRGEWFRREGVVLHVIDVLKSIAWVVRDYAMDGMELDALDLYRMILEDAERLGMVPEWATDPHADFWAER